MKKMDDFKKMDSIEVIKNDDLESIKGGNWWEELMMWLVGGCPPPWEEDEN